MIPNSPSVWLRLRTACAASSLPALLLLTLATPVQAQFEYWTNNGTITLSRYNGPGGAVVIPDTINGLPVTRIGVQAFSHRSITSVTIPISVTSIEFGAFSSCASLTSVTIPNSVTNLGDFAFEYCTSLTNVTIPNSVTSIGNWEFLGCASLGSITIPDSITSIGFAAFGVCASLTSVTIPSSVTNIELGAFGACASLSAITVDALNSVYSSVDGVLFNKSQTLFIQYPGGKAGSYTIPNNVTSIGESAFSSCAGLTSVTIPNGTTNIGARAFSFATNLTSVTIPNSVTSIGDNAFYNCSSLTSVTIPNSVTSIGGIAFALCASLSAITVDALNPFYSSADGVLFTKSQTLLIQSPGGKAGSYTIPNSVTSIGGYAFFGCASLTSVTIPNSVTSIGVRAFWSCSSLTGVYFQGNAPSEGGAVFLGADNATVYNLPGTTGWGPTFAEIPAVVWTPRIATSDANFGVRTNRFEFSIIWSSGMVTVVEACTNLTNPVWSPVGTNTLTGGSSYFSDPQWTNHPVRFYRLRSP